jgi:hypothetical protein
MLRAIAAAMALLLSSILSPAWGAVVRAVDATEEDGRYVASFDAVIDAPMDRVLPLMLTPGRWPQLSPLIVDAKVLEKADNGPRKVSITFYDCIFIFCKTIHKTEDITIMADGHIESLAIPEQSDFSYAREDWHIYAEAGRTHIHYKTEMVPDFFVPPLIGPYFIKSHLRSHLIDIANNLEKLTQSAAKPESGKDQ